MTRDAWTAQLSEYVDDELDAAGRAALEAHLTDCPACRNTVAELRRVKSRAAALPDRGPAADLWPGIASRIGVAVPVAPSGRATWTRRRWTFTLPQLAAAGLALAALGGAAVWLAQPPSAPPGGIPPEVAASPGERATGPRVRLAASEPYDQAVADLERVLAENRSRLDTATVRVLEESLRTIDRAIARARAALAADPSDAYLNAHLAETMRRKVDLLRRAAALATAAS